MHREISHGEEPFYSDTPLSLYLLTGILGLLIAADLWPGFIQWTGWTSLPTWSREVFGYRFALLAAIIGGARTLYGSLDSLFAGRLGADLAVALACIAAILIGEPLVAAEVVFIGMIGEVLESITFERTQRAVRKLAEIRPRRCWLLKDGQEVRIKVNELKEGDHVVVKPGARIPADGVVLDGRSAVDLSALTGESLPVEKGPGDEVLTGSLNQYGALTIEAQKVAENTVVGRVLKMTGDALQKKGNVERTADRLAKYFLPVVLGLALLTFIVGLLLHSNTEAGVEFWQAARLATYPALSILVVACPCALILATPAAIIAALGRLAGTGVLIKSGAAIEKLAGIETVAFDKTGTLTEGRLELGEVIPFSNVSEDQLLQMAATAEQRSEHVIAELIVKEANERKLDLSEVEEFEAHPGSGVTTKTSHGVIVVGTPRLMQEQKIDLSQEAQEALSQLDAKGQTALLVAKDGVIQGLVGARDRVRPEAADILTELRNQGIGRIALLTGDRQAAANVVAEQLKIDEVHAELLPDQKANWVHECESSSVAMIGDGINDAPALAQADVGIAIGGSGSDIAAEAGDIVMMGDPLKPLPLLVRLSRETVRIINQNILIFAFGVNILGIVLTAWIWPLVAPSGWYESSPIAAVIYHQLGSFLVLLNAMRLLWFERETTARMKRWKERVGKADEWLQKTFDVDEWLHGLLHRWKTVLSVILILTLSVFVLSGITVIAPDEVGVVQRFGCVVDEDLNPGWHWRMPWPIEKITKVKPNEIRTVEVGYRLTTEAKEEQAAGWSSEHGKRVERQPEEATMMTGDGNLVELQASIRFRVANPRVFLFAVKEPTKLLRSMAESVIRETVAGRTFTDLLTRGRKQAQSVIQSRLEQQLSALSQEQIGIKIEGISFLELHPPPEVVPSYHKVTKAMEEKKKRIIDARRSGLENEQQAESKALRDRREAAAMRFSVVRLAKAAREVFLAKLQARNGLSLKKESKLMALMLFTPELGDTPEKRVEAYQKLRAKLVDDQKKLSNQRIRLEILESSLSDREKVLLDAKEPLPFYLYALEQLRELMKSERQKR